VGLFVLAGLFLVSQARTYVDGHPVGNHVCQDFNPEPFTSGVCDAAMTLGRSMLDDAAPGHAQVATIEVYTSDYRDQYGSHRLRTTGTNAQYAIIVLRLADQSVRAFPVSCMTTMGEPDKGGCSPVSPQPDWQ
jgi:hypothetical protein